MVRPAPLFISVGTLPIRIFERICVNLNPIPNSSGSSSSSSGPWWLPRTMPPCGRYPFGSAFFQPYCYSPPPPPPPLFPTVLVPHFGTVLVCSTGSPRNWLFVFMIHFTCQEALARWQPTLLRSGWSFFVFWSLFIRTRSLRYGQDPKGARGCLFMSIYRQFIAHWIWPRVFLVVELILGCTINPSLKRDERESESLRNENGIIRYEEML